MAIQRLTGDEERHLKGSALSFLCAFRSSLRLGVKSHLTKVHFSQRRKEDRKAQTGLRHAYGF
jgi:hypothetical protein